jgi:hypothetical protein
MSDKKMYVTCGRYAPFEVLSYKVVGRKRMVMLQLKQTNHPSSPVIWKREEDCQLYYPSKREREKIFRAKSDGNWFTRLIERIVRWVKGK